MRTFKGCKIVSTMSSLTQQCQLNCSGFAQQYQQYLWAWLCSINDTTQFYVDSNLSRSEMSMTPAEPIRYPTYLVPNSSYSPWSALNTIITVHTRSVPQSSEVGKVRLGQASFNHQECKKELTVILGLEGTGGGDIGNKLICHQVC